MPLFGHAISPTVLRWGYSFAAATSGHALSRGRWKDMRSAASYTSLFTVEDDDDELVVFCRVTGTE